MWTWILRALSVAAPAAVGYFVNDVGDGIAKILPDKAKDAVTEDDGKFKWWYVLAIFLVVGALVAFIISQLVKMAKGKRGSKKGSGLFGIILLLAGLTAYFCLLNGLVSFFIQPGDIVLATALVTMTTGAAVITTAQLNFLPERISFTAATQLTGVKITSTERGVFFDSDAAGLTAIGVNRIMGQVTNNYVLQLANDLIQNTPVLFEFTNSAAQTPTVYYDSDLGVVENPQIIQTAKYPFQVGGTEVKNFVTLSLPNLGAGDMVTIVYKDGTVQANMNRFDLQYRLGFTQNIVNTPVYQIDNWGDTVASVTVIVAVAQTGYIQRMQPATGIIGGLNNAL